jgi:myo-inositol-1(or 4)-monophosphatase
MEKAAEKAAVRLVRDFGELEKLQVSRRGFNNFVTSADKNSESKIIYELSRARPEFSLLCEESGFVERENKSSVWIVDPIDGTSNFMRGIPHFAINIALREDDRITAGMTLDPMRGDCFKAEEGNGAFLGNRNRIRVSGRERMQESIVAMRNVSIEKESALINSGAVVRNLGSVALDLAYLAAGKFDAVITNDVYLWDIASGLILIKEAGGFLEYTEKDEGKYDVVAASSLRLLNFIKK